MPAPETRPVLGLIAGNGRFPFLAAAGARRAGGEFWLSPYGRRRTPDWRAKSTPSTGWDWVSWKGDRDHAPGGVHEAIMAGQVKHRQIFAGIVPDLKLMGVLARLALQNTDSLIGGVADALAREGITLLPSVAFLQDALATEGAMTRRRPSREERRDIEYGERVARTLAGMDLGQTAVVKDRAAVALEAMEGTDETIRRAGRIAGPGTIVVKVAKPRQDVRFDVPVVGPGTLVSMEDAGARVLALDAGRTLLIEKMEFLSRADSAGVAVWACRSRRRRGRTAMSDPVRVGVIGVGALGRHHARVWAEAAGAVLEGVYDAEASRATEWRVVTDAEPLRTSDRSWMRSTRFRSPFRRPTIARSPVSRSNPAGRAGREARHTTLEEADELIALASARRMILQVGHIERSTRRPRRCSRPGRRPLRGGSPARLLLGSKPGHRRRSGPDDPRPRHRARA